MRNYLCRCGPVLVVFALVGLVGCPTASISPESIAISALSINLESDAEAVFRSAPIFESVEGKVGSHGGTVAALSDGSLLAAWYSYDGPDERNGAGLYMSRRAAGSAEWEAPVVHIQDSKTRGNPVLYAEGDSVWLFHCVTTEGWGLAHIEMERSFDGGATWSARREIAGPTGSCTRAVPIRTPQGALVLPAYSDWIQQSHFFVSYDGETWDLLSSVFTNPPYQNLQPSIARLSDGRIMAVMRNVSRGWLWTATSADEGSTWSTPTDSGFPNPGSAPMLTRLASGNLILIFNDSDLERFPLSVSLSQDDGKTWTKPRAIVTEYGVWDYPSAVQSADGLIHITYTAYRARIMHAELNEAWIVATSDAGERP